MKFISKKLSLPAQAGAIGRPRRVVCERGLCPSPVAVRGADHPDGAAQCYESCAQPGELVSERHRTASSYTGSGYGLLMQQFQAVRDQYAGFKSTLNPQQLNSGANQLAELDSGPGHHPGGFHGLPDRGGQRPVQLYTAFANMCQVLNEAMGVWAQEFKQDCRQLQVGW